ncbi:MAG: UDP-N-acetylglucosamine--N-acetylmuramyl-(pentapeptide) pyrophosphoryl-undecaprenol N-acetylglucosamine transferase [Anaerolineales bacterium]|nr:UDP-N-acetylglucosamine--N-acetylmuramyl-(pentapeptide) pyrophosphoryl-undecaprenol N-acetylglucosamine transferase [Anaerolineales bacterium]
MRLLVAAGASGGGVYPALAVLQELGSDVELLWVGAEGGLEEELVTRAGYTFRTLPTAGLQGVGLLAIPANLLRMLRGYRGARQLLAQFRPDVLFFTGSFVAAPVALAGRRLPSLVFVPDIRPFKTGLSAILQRSGAGFAVRIISNLASVIAVVAEQARAYFRRPERVEVTGYPLRAEITRWAGEGQRTAARQHFGLEADQPVLLVFGGSKGSLSINRALLAALPELLVQMQVLHISGQEGWAEVQTAQEQLPPRLSVRYRAYPYLHEDMGAAFAAADLAVCRAGASTLGELPRFGLPAVLVPIPFKEHLQHVNAGYLQTQGAALVLADEEMPARLAQTVTELMQDKPRLQKLAAAMAVLAAPGAAAEIAGHLRRLGGLRG